MVENLFNAIVEALLLLCARTGLTYSEINILIYCGLIPATWFGIVYLRRRRWVGLLVLHLLLPAIYFRKKRALIAPSEKFYDANIHALERLGVATGWGYVGVSVVIGVGIPLFIYGGLILLPKRWLPGFYLFLISGNLAWYAWVLRPV